MSAGIILIGLVGAGMALTGTYAVCEVNSAPDRTAAAEGVQSGYTLAAIGLVILITAILLLVFCHA